jgi:hypothetical protein
MHEVALLTTELHEPEKMAIIVSNEVTSPQVEAVNCHHFLSSCTIRRNLFWSTGVKYVREVRPLPGGNGLRRCDLLLSSVQVDAEVSTINAPRFDPYVKDPG